MKIICAWCGKDMGEKEPLEDKGITHGMCEDCFKRETSKESDKQTTEDEKVRENNG